MRMGLPSILMTDNGSEFKNKLNDAMMKQLGIRHCLITQVCNMNKISSIIYMSYLISQMVLMSDTIRHFRECFLRQ